MIFVTLSGGLGNQMFQYAAARSIAHDEKIIFDLSSLKQNKHSTAYFTARPYELGIFKHLNRAFLNPLWLKFILTQNKLYQLFKFLLPARMRLIIRLNDVNYNSYRPQPGPVHLRGYFQNPRYFEAFRAQIIHDFSFPKTPEKLKSILADIKQNNSVSVHVRRTDYLKSNIDAYHGVLERPYYERAINIIKSVHQQAIFYIFSDDINWCRDQLIIPGIHMTFVHHEDQPAWTDLFLMSQCKHNIIANSSFSWWAAWLNINKEKTVIAPQRWFKNTDTQIIPDEWTKI